MIKTTKFSHSECQALSEAHPADAKMKCVGLGRNAYGLRLCMRNGHAWWVQRLWFGNKSVDRSLGSIEFIQLGDAVVIASRNRAELELQKVQSRRFPAYTPQPAVTESVPRRTPKPRVPTFSDMAAETLADTQAAGKLLGKSGRGWTRRLEIYAYPVIGSKQVSDITRADILQILKPIWTDKIATGRQVKGAVALVLDRAVSLEYAASNPVDKIVAALPPVRRVIKHQRSCHHSELPEALSRLPADNKGLVIAFIALTAVRAAEATTMRWSEVDWAAATWTIPSERMKARTQHQVPLSESALLILKRVREQNDDGNDLVFPNVNGDPIDTSLLLRVLKRVDFPSSTHGTRSCFRSWCSENGKSRELAEAALSHAFGSEVERSYNRSSLLEQRRELMEQWANYLTIR